MRGTVAAVVVHDMGHIKLTRIEQANGNQRDFRLEKYEVPARKRGILFCFLIWNGYTHETAGRSF